MVLKLAQVADSYLPDEDEGLPESVRPRSRHRQRRYNQNYPCIICRSNLASLKYHRLGDNLIEAHESTESLNKIPREGCCFLCLLLFQFKCRNGYFQSPNILPAKNNGLKAFHFLRAETLLLFSHSIDEPVTIDRYLPQG
jgi:hypothetical protein